MAITGVRTSYAFIFKCIKQEMLASFLSLPFLPPRSFTLRSPTSLPACRLFVFNLVLMPSSIIVKIITLNVNAESESKQQPSKRGTGGEATQYAGNGKNVRQQRASWLKRGRWRWGKWQWEKTRAAQQENGKYVSSGYKEKWVHGSGRWFKRVVIIKFYTYTHTQPHSQTLAHSYATTHTHSHTCREQQ